MSTLLLALYTQNHWTADGVQTVWNFTFADGYLRQAFVKAYSQSPGGVQTPIALTAPNFTGPFQLTITPAVPAGHKLVIYRESLNGGVPLVNFADGAAVSETALDETARQAVHCAAEALDVAHQLALNDEYGYKSLRKITYTGASVVQATDNGQSHVKTDGAPITVPDTLNTEFLCTLSNLGNFTLNVAFAGAVTVAKDGAGAVLAGTSVSIPPYSTATIWRASATLWLVSGNVTAI